MDFVSAHHGAIPLGAMVSPGQFDHPLVAAQSARSPLPRSRTASFPRTTSRARSTTRTACSRTLAGRATNSATLRMWSIHPRQIEPIVDAMRPAVPEVEKAQAIIHAAQDADWGPLRIDGELHDRASYRQAWSTLQRARAAGVPLDPAPPPTSNPMRLH